MDGSSTQPTGTGRRSLLLVSFEQFGYHTDTFEYCRNLRDSYKITYLCIDQGLPRRVLSGIDIIYCSAPAFGKVELGLLRAAHRAIQAQHYDVVFLRRTKFSFLLRILHPRVRMVFDVRTGSIEESPRRRGIENMWVRLNARFFRSITVISSGLAEQLRLPRRAKILPLGADPPPKLTSRRPDEVRLIYVGTFKNRKIHRTVEGLAIFVSGSGVVPNLRYTIVGFGPEEDEQRLHQIIEKHGVGKLVDLRPRVDHGELWSVLAEHDVGVAFTPRVPWFEHQPSTKVFEYLQSGLPVIATDTDANREVITDCNGILIDDTPEGFCRGLQQVIDRLGDLEPEAVAETARDFSWEKIVDHKLVPILEAAQQ